KKQRWMKQGFNRLLKAVLKIWINITVLYESDVLSHLKFISMFNLVLWKPQPKCWLAELRAWRCRWLNLEVPLRGQKETSAATRPVSMTALSTVMPASPAVP